MKKAYSYIRFSTPDQIKGDSLRRQLELSEKYCSDNKLTLDSSLRDLGKSGFDGSNRKSGALKDFFELVENGKIAKGSYLLIENLDRLSREKPMDAYDQFREIIRAGITVVTLSNGLVFSEESLNREAAQLYIIVGEIQRAHTESKRKSETIGKAWEQNRDIASKGGKKLTKVSPIWLKLSDDRMEYITIHEIVEAVREIFRLKTLGYGRVKITKTMNGGTFWKPKKNKRNKIGGWQESFVSKILGNRAVLGEHQFHKYIDGKRTPIGEVMENYYPQIIERALWDSVHSLMAINREKSGNSGGKTGKVSNLFTNIAYCSKCLSPLHYLDKGKPPKGAKYFHCSSAKFDRGCNAKMIRYDKFEKFFFDIFNELKMSELIPSADESQKDIQRIDDRLISIPRQISELEEKIDKTIDFIEEYGGSKELNQRLNDRQKEKQELIKEEEDLQKQRKLKSVEAETIQKDMDTTKEVYQLLAEAKNEEERINLRLRLRTEIKKFVDVIRIKSLYETPKPGNPYFFGSAWIKFHKGNQRMMQIFTEPNIQ